MYSLRVVSSAGQSVSMAGIASVNSLPPVRWKEVTGRSSCTLKRTGFIS